MAAFTLSTGERVLVDDADLERIKAYGNWYRHTRTQGGTPYVQSRGWGFNGQRVLLHRFILGLEKGDGLHGDHINGDGLDNRSENLQALTPAQHALITRARKVRNQPGGEVIIIGPHADPEFDIWVAI